MKIRTKIFLAFFITGFTLTIVGVSVFYFFSANKLQKVINQHLETVAKLKANSLANFFSDIKETIKQYSNETEYKYSLQKLEQYKDDKTNPEYIQAKEFLEEKISNCIKSHSEFQQMFFVDTSGEIIFVSTPEAQHLGKLLDKEFPVSYSLFDKAKEGIYLTDILSTEEPGQNIILLIAPLDLDGEFIGLMVLTIKIDEIDKLVEEKTGLGETGETYLVGSDGLMRSNSRLFKQSTILRQKVDTENSRQCFQNLSEELKKEHIDHEAVNIFDGYRGKSVLGTHIFIPEMQWCLLAEIDKDEVLSPINELVIISALIALIILFVIYTVSVWIRGLIAKPIEKFKADIEIIEKGNLDHKTAINTKDEIGQLSQAFDRMTEKIKESRMDVDKKVTDQTKEIIEKEEVLRERQEALINVLEDVGDEKQKATREKDKIDAILHSIGDGVFVIDGDSRIIIFNQIAARISGFSPKEAIGKKYDQILKFVYEKDGRINDQFIKKAFSTGQIQQMSNHTFLIRKDGRKISVADSAAPILNQDKKIVGCVVVFRDIGKEREVDRMKSEFISLASHQLRTPLSAMKWFSEMLLSEDAGRLNKEQKEFAQNIYQSNERMIELIEALLNISRIESGRLIVDPKQTDLKKLIEEVLKEIEPKFLEKNQKIVAKIDPQLPLVNIDSKLIRHVYVNLITNAIKYTPKDREISVIVSRKDNKVVSQVTDSGLGIPKDEQTKVFQKFFRAENIVKLETDGTGLGLYLVKSIIDSSGGEIWFKSEENKGTTFWFTLPIGKTIDM